MTALVPKPVILRVVRSIERVEQGLETSDRGFLRKVVCCHVAGRYRARFGREARRRSLPVRRSTGSALKWANLRTTFPSPATGSEDTRTLSDPGTALDGSNHVRPGMVRTSGRSADPLFHRTVHDLKGQGSGSHAEIDRGARPPGRLARQAQGRAPRNPLAIHQETPVDGPSGRRASRPPSIKAGYRRASRRQQIGVVWTASPGRYPSSRSLSSLERRFGPSPRLKRPAWCWNGCFPPPPP